MKHFLNENIPAVLLTGNSQSNLIPLAAQAIVFTQEEMDFLKVSTFSSQVAFEYILDTLFLCYTQRSFNKISLHLKRKMNGSKTAYCRMIRKHKKPILLKFQVESVFLPNPRKVMINDF